MFGGRSKRSTPNPPLTCSYANASATTAAAQAFLKSQTSNASLSAAAAAAALRSLPTPPTSVADVQTKRMFRRNGSISSQASSFHGSRGPLASQPQRSGSSGSMSERSLRSHSPARSHAVPDVIDAPPVPALPRDMQQRGTASLYAPVASTIPTSGERRLSLVPRPMLTLGGRYSMSSAPVMTEIDRPSSRGSVNFSLPTSSRPTSPITERRLTYPSPSRETPARIVSPSQEILIYDRNTRRFLPESEILAIEQTSCGTAKIPAKKKIDLAPSAPGINLASGIAGMELKGAGTASDPAAKSIQELAAGMKPTPVMTRTPSVPESPKECTRAPIADLRKKNNKLVDSDSESGLGSRSLSLSETDSDLTQAVSSKKRSKFLLGKRPSMVVEAKEDEQELNSPSLSKNQDGPFPILDSITIRTTNPPSILFSHNEHGNSPQSSASAVHSQNVQVTSSTVQRASSLSDKKSRLSNGVCFDTGDTAQEGVQPVSSARTTHFATTPERSIIRHSPSPRPISPRKSAMKHSRNISNSSQRDESPRVSETGTVTSDELSSLKKKANRVSFDETNVLIGQAAGPISDSSTSPVSSSPQSKRPWFSIGRANKKDIFISSDESDEVMKPRPALPSFGSIREKKRIPEPEERQLVKPTENIDYDTSPVSHQPVISPSGEYSDSPIGKLNDHMICSLTSPDNYKNIANISKSREPLPLQLTAAERSDCNSTSESSIQTSDNKPDGISKASSSEYSPGNRNPGIYTALGSDPQADLPLPPSMTSTQIPRIDVQAATPTLETTGMSQAWLDMPGSWESSADSSTSNSPKEDKLRSIIDHHATDASPADAGIAEPNSIQPLPEEITGILSSSTIVEESEESEAESIYSDAAEDLSDFDGDGFMSLNAVVESPVKTESSVPGHTISTTPKSQIMKPATEKAYGKSQRTRVTSVSDADLGRDKDQSYWSNVSSALKYEWENEAQEKPRLLHAEEEAKTEPKTKLVIKQADLASSEHQYAPFRERSYIIEPGRKAGPNGLNIVRSSLPAKSPGTAPKPHIKKSIRASGSMSGSLHAKGHAQPECSARSNHNPNSFRTAVWAEPVAVTGPVKSFFAARPGLRRQGSGDSASSFRRTRRASEAPILRRSMRVSELDTIGCAQSSMRQNRDRFRSLSPIGSSFRRPLTSDSPAQRLPSSQTHIRRSMRDSAGPPPVMRSMSSSRIPGFGKLSSSKAATRELAPRGLSRFADSSDEDEARPNFKSRFVDSSDEDKHNASSKSKNGTGLYGIPKFSELIDDDSSDLPDSDDERLAPGRKNGATPGTALSPGSLRFVLSREMLSSPSAIPQKRIPDAKRGSLMSSILRRKQSDPNNKVRKSNAESPARRDTPLERSRLDLAALRGDRSTTSKLQKRITGITRKSSDATPIWPRLAPVSRSAQNSDGRSFSVDGELVTKGGESFPKNSVGVECFTPTGLHDVGPNTAVSDGHAGMEASNSAQKKKKFGALRRIFKFDD